MIWCNLSINNKSPNKYKFNINPNTLSADYELWICGSATSYYLMPIELMREIYNNPNTYIDSMHPEIRVVSVDVNSNNATFASGGVGCNLKKFFGVGLDCFR